MNSEVGRCDLLERQAKHTSYQTTTTTEFSLHSCWSADVPVRHHTKISLLLIWNSSLWSVVELLLYVHLVEESIEAEAAQVDGGITVVLEKKRGQYCKNSHGSWHYCKLTMYAESTHGIRFFFIWKHIFATTYQRGQCEPSSPVKLKNFMLQVLKI